MKELERCGLHPRPGGVRLRTLRGADWAESWKRHFKPFDIGTALLVKPSWSPRRPRKGQAVIVIDPGLSFGTGHHPTTSFCLEQVARCRRPGTPQSLLDAGAGSGILAIAAARLGFNPVHAFDFDPQAVRVARENAQSNGVLESVRFACRDLRKLPLRVTKRFTIVCANLLADLLLAESARLLNRLEPGGTLVVAGILRKEFPQIQRHYEKAGMRLVASQSKNEWRSGAFRFAA